MATTEQRLKEYEQLYKQAQSYDPNKFQNEFEKAYGEATGYNQDLINQQSQSLGELQAVAPTLRSQYSNSLITDPTRQMALIAQARQAPITSFSNAANLLTARGNRYQDILGKALGGYQTSAQQANTAAENAWRLYQDAVQQSQFNRSQSGGSSNWLKDLLGGDEEQPKQKELTAQDRVEAAINSLASTRKTKDIEVNMNKYHQQIIDMARQYGLTINPEALWVRLGNELKTPQTLSLYRY